MNKFKVIIKKINSRTNNFRNYTALEKEFAISDFYWLVKTQYVYRKFFDYIGPGTRILKPLRINGERNIWIGKDVLINRFSWLFAQNRTKGRIIIEDGCRIGNFNHITAIDQVRIGRGVLTADRVHISDNYHNFERVDISIQNQGVLSKKKVVIGEGTWIGEGVSILSARIGKNCVIGANSVVIKDIPDYCVAVGVPAVIIKRYDEGINAWKRV